MNKDQWLAVWVAWTFSLFVAVLVILLTVAGCDTVTGPTEAEYTVDCNNYFNYPCPEEGGDDE